MQEHPDTTDPNRGYHYASLPTQTAHTPTLRLGQPRNEPQLITIPRRPALKNALRKNPQAAIGMRQAWNNAIARAIQRDQLWPMTTPIRVTANAYYITGETPPDTDAIQPAVELALDALVTQGIIPDDNPDHIRQIVLNRPEHRDHPGLAIQLEHLP